MRRIIAGLVFCLCLCGVNTAAWAMQKGDAGDAVQSLQEALIEEGYLAREADGVFGSTTEKALRLYQRDQGLPVTSQADETMLTRLAETDAPRDGGGILYAPGNLGADIFTLQQLFAAEGYEVGAPDGVYGEQLTQAVQTFQRGHGLQVIGAIDEKTWSLLTRGRDIAISRGAVKGMRERAAHKKPAAKRSRDKAQTVKKSSRSAGKIGLQQGDSGKHVRLLQSRLVQNGYDVGIIDATFGGATRSALQDWQKSHGVTANGVADEFFWNESTKLMPAPSKYLHKWTMHASAYSSQDGGTGSHTARGSLLSRGHVAVDPSLIPLGSLLYVEGYGYALADDIGGAIRGKTIDVAMESYDEAIQWGRRDVTVYLIKKGHGK